MSLVWLSKVTNNMLHNTHEKFPPCDISIKTITKHFPNHNYSSSRSNPIRRCLLSKTALNDSCSARSCSLYTLCFFDLPLLWLDMEPTSSGSGLDFYKSWKQQYKTDYSVNPRCPEREFSFYMTLYYFLRKKKK